MSRRNGREPRRIKSIEVGFRILRVLEHAQKPLPLTVIAEAAKLPASNAYLYLASFVHESMVEQDAMGHYGLGSFAVVLGAAATRQAGLVDLGKDLLGGLRAQTRDSVFLSIWGNRGPTIVHKIDGDEYGPIGLRVGHVLPLLGTATGGVFLAWMPTARTERLVDQERGSAVSLAAGASAGTRSAALAEASRSVRRMGYAVADSAVNGGLFAASAPVFDQGGQLCAAITILGPGIGQAGADRAIDELRRTAAELSKRLGAPVP
ncbi:MAG: hypothetical protein ABS43_05785 [Bordetella sp. SCN 67-23]|nr:IclR family transcriptional regulator [Burkholderiales bacterium]ODS75318.1 MAG: hypothetical protein ABS43_05785 [Bordetella sp. SCN 67-23]OJW88949.1 MAG: hypothetical protein BGO71_04700 [Burkholderiales bacterium 67-32]